MVVLSLCMDIWIGLFSVTACVEEGLKVHYRPRMWLVMERRKKTVTQIQGNVRFFHMWNRGIELITCAEEQAKTRPSGLFH